MEKPKKHVTDVLTTRADELATGPARLLSQGRIIETAIGLVVAVLSVVVIWGEPRPIGDLYAGLAVGQDVVDGKLGQVDDWAFTTPGKVAINQNWGTHFVHYLVYRAAGPTGLLVLKMAMIGAAALFICLVARQRKVSWGVALVVAAGAIAAGRSYIDLRANLSTLVIAPLALWWLLLARRNVHWMWPVMILNGIWANVHGGFIFGLGMTGLWAGILFITRTIEIVRTQRPLGAAIKTILARLWPLPVATLGSIALAAFVNPYGTTNLTFPFTIMDPAWQRLNEWQPLLSNATFGTTWEFFIVVGILAALLVFRVAGIPGVPASYPPRPTLENTSLTVFDLALIAVVVSMTFRARRFVPLSVIVLAPFIAVQVQWLVDLLRRWKKLAGTALVLAGALALGIPLTWYGHWLMRLYDPNNPTRPTETFFERMHGTAHQPVKAAEFLAANGISGRCFNEWRWEGYIHWKVPDLKVFIGGRAHQIYSGALDTLAGRIMADPRKFRDPRYQVNPSKDLADNNVHLVVVPVPVGNQRVGLVWDLVERRGSTWTYIYFDGKDIVIADTSAPATAALVRRALADDLTYPDEASATLSRAMAMTAACLQVPPSQALEAFMTAAQVHPLPVIYDAIRQISRMMGDDKAWLKAYFEREYARLEQMDTHRPWGLRVLLMRAQLAKALWEIYHAEGDLAQAARFEKAQRQAVAAVKAMEAEWP